MPLNNPSTSSFGSEYLSWDFSSFNNFTNADENCETVTTMVRTRYMNYIKRSLEHNYEKWLDSNKGNDDINCSKEDMLKCAKVLECKAMRACMMTRYYQQAMMKTMNEIKKSTEEGSLFSPIIENVYDNKIKNQYEKGTQTSLSLTYSTVEKSEQSEGISQMQHTKEISITGKIMSNPNAINPEPRTTDNFDNEEENYLEDVIKKSPNSSEKNDDDKASSPKKNKYEEESIENTNSDNENESNDSSNPGVEIINRNLEERIQNLAVLLGIDESNLNPEVLENRNEQPAIHATNNITEEVSSTCDNNSMISESDKLFKPALDWKCEQAAQNCNLKRILASLDSRKKTKVQQKFNELFGTDEPMDTEISIAEAALSRNRTAHLVVGVLTPYYFQGKIISKNVFKSLAKKITYDILQITHTASLAEVTDKVNSYFHNGRCINSEEDIVNP